MLDSALHLAVELEQPVIPLAPREKRPIVRHGLRSATSDEATVRRWWARTPDANIGLVMGLGLVALDIDGAAGKRSLALLEREQGKLPPTVEAITRRGRHIFFSVPDDTIVRPSAGRLGEGIDVRGDRSYVVAPPSIHPSGFVYRWKRGHAPGRHVLANAPAWLLEALLHAVPGATRKAPRPGETGGPGTACGVPARIHDRSASGRDFHLALRMIREGASDRTIEDAIRRLTKRDESYILFTVRNARLMHEANAVSATVREVVPSLEPKEIEGPVINALRKEVDRRQLEFVKSGKLVPVQFSSRHYDFKRTKWIFGKASEEEIELLLARKVYWQTRVAGGSAWIGDPAEALYVETTSDHLLVMAKKMASQDLIKLEGDRATANPSLMAQADKFETDMRTALDELEKKHAFERG